MASAMMPTASSSLMWKTVVCDKLCSDERVFLACETRPARVKPRGAGGEPARTAVSAGATAELEPDFAATVALGRLLPRGHSRRA